MSWLEFLKNFKSDRLDDYASSGKRFTIGKTWVCNWDIWLLKQFKKIWRNK